MAEALSIDLFSLEYRANPYQFYARAREQGPLYQFAQYDEHAGWMVMRYEDAEEILRDPRFIKHIRSLIPPEERRAPDSPLAMALEQINNHMLSSDPPDHTRLRGLVSKAFTPRMIEQWRPRIQEITDALLDAVQEHGEMDLISDFAFPLPMTVISEMLGIPDADRQQFRTWSNMIINSFGSQENFEQIIPDMMAFAQYLFGYIEQRRQHPQDDLVSKLLLAEEAGDKLAQNELISMIFLLLVAGHETTVNLLGNGMLALLLHPRQIEKLQQQPDLIRSAVEELLRYNGPLYTATGRWASEDVNYKGTMIKRGDAVIIGLSSANHDGQQFADGEDLDITRKENQHLAFGKGIHYCLGAPLARLEGQIAISTLFRRFPNLHLNTDPRALTWRPGTLVHGLNELPVSF
ncbi:MAG TPA: cytochrome P450 [Ktedonobacteraceae bacterium]|jgi:cytochrome P450|nr:cytochrome P450 [Ktedonobacteraceae bacterium]